MATAPLTLNIGQTALLMADFHLEGMGDNPMAQERGTGHTSRAGLEADDGWWRQALYRLR